VKIGNDSYLLPVGFEVSGGITDVDLWHLVAVFKNHRHFETSTTSDSNKRLNLIRSGLFRGYTSLRGNLKLSSTCAMRTEFFGFFQ